MVSVKGQLVWLCPEHTHDHTLFGSSQLLLALTVVTVLASLVSCPLVSSLCNAGFRRQQLVNNINSDMPADM